jgi:hypothetical protein
LHQRRLLEANKAKAVIYKMPAKQDQPVRVSAPEDQQRHQANA